MQEHAPSIDIHVTAEDGSESTETQTLDTQRDSVDFRDKIYQPSLRSLKNRCYPALDHVRVLNQGREGACTGFGLAATINYLNKQRSLPQDKQGRVSPRMLYEMAKRYDRWPGENYDGSSCRGAMKGWFKHGVCREDLCPMW